ncbi:hypothetical protein ANN_10625 [Periplaneta americana]|uniref:Uncharacterized protein n=1 Tax=Periplaneta americana TaxID=6978 RepID=A0ABQ8T3Z3_PERAM|nr:hypothetical protein ANN_10625 [Periplaneta americana]
MKNDWFDSDCQKALEERHKARKIYLDRPTRNKYNEYQKKRQEANYICRRKERELWNKRIIEMENNFKENNLKSAYREVKYNRKGYVPTTNLLRNGEEIVSTP